MPRGGRRQGAPGKNYANRSDMATGPRKLPIQVAPGQPYGAAGQQRAAEQAVPMATGDITPAGGPPPASLADAQQSASDFNPPPVVPIGAPTMLPNEHVMTSPPTPQAPNAPDPLLNGVALMNSLGDTASPEVKALRNVVSAQQANSAAP